MPLLGIRVDEKYYIDCSPPFGCRTSALACERMSSAVLWLFKQQGFQALCYLDDFVGVASSLEEATCAYNALLALLSRLGLQVSLHKCIPPTTLLTWLGFSVDTRTMTVKIPKEKLSDTLLECKAWVPGMSASRRHLQRLVGRLKHISKCVPQAAKFFARILSALRKNPFIGKHPVPLDVFSDIEWFLRFSEMSNGVFLLPPLKPLTWEIECDSTLLAGGAYSPDKFFSELYTQQYISETSNIAQLEALNLIQALHTLLPENPEQYKIIVNTDNIASQQVLSSGSGKDPLLCVCARQLWLIAATYSTELVIVHKPGKDLLFADALSRAPTDPRFHKKASDLASQKNLQRVTITHSLHDLLSKI